MSGSTRCGAVATCLSNAECNIEESSQFHDNHSGQFFMRVLFSAPNEGAVARFQDNFSEIANSFSMHYAIEKQDKPLKTLILVSKASHCLNDLLYRWRTRSLNIDIVGVIGNHDTNQSLAEDRSIPFTFVDSINRPAKKAGNRSGTDRSGALHASHVRSVLP